MLYLGIDQHARQITISLRDENGDVLMARQVSTRPEKIHEFFMKLTRERLQKGESFMTVLEVCGFNDWLIRMLQDYRCHKVILIQPLFWRNRRGELKWGKSQQSGFRSHASHVFCEGRTKSQMESLALLNRDGCFAWVDDLAPWGWCHDLVLGTPAWQWVTSDNVEAVKTAYSRCLILGEPQQFLAEVSLDGRKWSASTSLVVPFRRLKVDCQAKVN